MTAKTPVYQLEYIVQGEPVRNTRLALENNAKTIEAALIKGGIAPADAQSALAVLGRVATLEANTVAPVPVPYVNAAGVATGWSAYNTGGWKDLRVWRQARTAFCTGLVKPSVALAVGTSQIIGRIPLGFRPPSVGAAAAIVPDMHVTLASGQYPLRVDISNDGLMTAVNNGTVTVPVGAFCPLNFHWHLDAT